MGSTPDASLGILDGAVIGLSLPLIRIGANGDANEASCWILFSVVPAVTLHSLDRGEKQVLTEHIRSRDELLLAVSSGLRPNYLFFWGHKPLPNGEIGKSCFSQWWPAEFLIGDASYPTAEHFMMAEKARLFMDEESRAQILKAGSPKAAKQLGRQVKGFDQRIWEEARFRLVVEGNLAKFSQNNGLGEFLLETNEKVLVEASPMDRIWGIGMAASNAQAEHPEQWRGLNLLGFALMEVRHRLGEGHSD